MAFRLKVKKKIYLSSIIPFNEYELNKFSNLIWIAENHGRRVRESWKAEKWGWNEISGANDYKEKTHKSIAHATHPKHTTLQTFRNGFAFVGARITFVLCLFYAASHYSNELTLMISIDLSLSLYHFAVNALIQSSYGMFGLFSMLMTNTRFETLRLCFSKLLSRAL